MGGVRVAQQVSHTVENGDRERRTRPHRPPPPRTQARAVTDPDEPAAKSRPVPECRWLDTLATDGPFSTEPLLALTTTKGFLFSAGLTQLTTRNVSTIYYQVPP